MDKQDIKKHIYKKYKIKPDFPFAKYPDIMIFRHEDNKKWFSLIMNVEKNKLGLKEKGFVEIMNLKLDPDLIFSIRKTKGFFSAYHMNKMNWISIILDGSVEFEKLKMLIDMSFNITKSNEKYEKRKPHFKSHQK